MKMKTRKIKKHMAGYALAILLSSALPLQAQGGTSSVEALVQMLQAKGVITAAEAEAFTSQFASDTDSSAEPAFSEQNRAALIDDITTEVVKRIAPIVETSVEQKMSGNTFDEGKKQELIDDVSLEVAQRISPYVEARLENKLSKQTMKEGVRLELIDDVSSEVAQRVSPFIEARLDKNINDKMKEQEIGKADHWANRISFGGDMRLRYQGDSFDERNSNFLDPSELPDTVVYPQTNRDRARIRVRVKAKAKVNDQVDAVVQVSTGNETDPVSTNETLGDYQNKDIVVFNQAYVQWAPSKSLAASGVRIPNPWFSTDHLWDTDLNFEGLAGSYNKKFNDSLGGFLTLGAFSIDEFSDSSEDKYLYGAQAGFTSNFLDGISLKFAGAYYDYVNEVGKSDTVNGAPLTGHTAPQFLQKGNTLFYLDPLNSVVGLAAEFQEINITGKLDINFFAPVQISLIGDYVKNIGYDKDAVGSRIFGTAEAYKLGNLEENEGYQVGLSVGHTKVSDKGQWRTFLYYKYLEADAVLDAFTDSDFHLGGTHAKGWILGGEFGLAKNTWMSSRWLSSDEISGPQFSVDTLQVDLNLKY
nr:putative porin [Desulfobulbaceae bacterium]